MCEAGVNVKVIQDTLGHKDINTTLNICTDVTRELRKSEFEGLDDYFNNECKKGIVLTGGTFLHSAVQVYMGSEGMFLLWKVEI